LTSNSSTTVDSPISESSKEKAFLVDSFEIHDDYVEEKGKGKMTMDEKKDEEEEKERGGEEVVSSSASSYAIAIPSRQDEDAPATLPPSSLSSSFLSESLSSASLLSSSPSVHEGESPISTYAKTRVRKITNRRTQLKLPHLEKEKEHDLLSSPLNSVKTTSPIAAFSEMRTAEEEKEKEKGKETETEVKEAGVASLAPSENVTSFSKDLMSQISNSEGPSAVVNLASPALGASELVELHSPEYYSEVLSLILAKFKSTFQVLSALFLSFLFPLSWTTYYPSFYLPFFSFWSFLSSLMTIQACIDVLLSVGVGGQGEGGANAAGSSRDRQEGLSVCPRPSTRTHQTPVELWYVHIRLYCICWLVICLTQTHVSPFL